MENISLSLPKRSFSSNNAFTSHKSIYNDVFGGPPKLGLPTLAPRFEDYLEIFGGFHTSQSSSIPMLHLPLIASEDSSLYSDIDYTEVFGGCEGFDCTASVEDLVGHSSGRYDSDSSDDPWSPVQSGSLSDELDPLARSDKSQRLSDGDFRQSSENINKQTASYNKSCHISAGTVLTTTSHVANFSAVPGYTFSLYESPVSWGGDDEDCSKGMINNTNHGGEYGARVAEEKQCKCSSNSSLSGSDTHTNDSKPLEILGNSTSQIKPFVTVCDISLRTKPSRLPPPSRPPPVLAVKKSEHDKQNAELKPCQRHTSDRVADDTAPPFVYTKINATISGECKESENGNAKLEQKYFRSHSAANVEGKTNETARASMDTEDEKFLHSCRDKTPVSMPVVEGRMESIESTEEISVPHGVQCSNNSADNSARDVVWREATACFELQAEARGNENVMEAKLKSKDSPNRTDTEKRSVDSQITKQTRSKDGQNPRMEEFLSCFEDVKQAEMREIKQDRTGTQEGGVSVKQSESSLEENYDLNENGEILRDSKKHRESSDKSYIAAGHGNSSNRQLDCEKGMETGKLMVNESASRRAFGQARYDKDHILTCELDVDKERNQDVPNNDDTVLSFRMSETELVSEEEDFETTGNMKSSMDASLHEDMSEHAEEIEPNGHDESEVEWDLDSLILIDGDKLEVSEGGYKVDEATATKDLGKHDNMQMLRSSKRAVSPEENGDMKDKPKSSTYETETRGDIWVLGGFHEFSKNQDGSLEIYTPSAAHNIIKSPCVPKQMLDSKTCGSGMGVSHVTTGIISSELGHCRGEGQKMNSSQFTVKRVDISDNCNPRQVITESTVTGGKMEDVPSFLKQYSDRLSSKKDSTSQPIEVKNPNMRSNFAGKNQKVGERMRQESAPENEHMRKLEEEREREREREKDRMAVDKAALEAQERSYFEARERAAVERATVEVRQRALTEAQERLEKASVEARLRTDRAAVERATAEARQRAAEKLMAQKAAHHPLDRIEKSIPDRFSASSRFTDTRQSFLSSNINFQGTEVSNRLRYAYSSTHDGAESESPQRCKARLERYRRTAERAANALAEKNRRDFVAQKEREERNKVAEALDAEVKRWSSGKQGNLRALLSTLQYILGPDSGWHPVSLTEVITSAAVKKAYRRATLCVHPDKLQQRGATIQQKYICEKVFDLLKEAWNKFNSEER
ncbi:auxilin-like protein 1 [Salvia divinorum]|uniref:Auxilin-like protein 1 n=1 Tax=Salvia divinorum TaxID=28513 RepID=A0ABD1H019_SALDI